MVSINKYINPGEHRLIWTGNVNARVYRASYIAFSFIVDMKCGSQLTIIGGHAVGLSHTHTRTHHAYSTNVHVLHNLMLFSIEPVPCDDSSSSRLTPDWSHSVSLSHKSILFTFMLRFQTFLTSFPPSLINKFKWKNHFAFTDPT